MPNYNLTEPIVLVGSLPRIGTLKMFGYVRTTKFRELFGHEI